jgi:hypothetical protein
MTKNAALRPGRFREKLEFAAVKATFRPTAISTSWRTRGPMGTIELTSAPEPDVGFVAGGGSMGKLVRDFDWSQTDLGPLAGWGPELKSAVSLVLEITFPRRRSSGAPA